MPPYCNGLATVVAAAGATGVVAAAGATGVVAATGAVVAATGAVAVVGCFVFDKYAACAAPNVFGPNLPSATIFEPKVLIKWFCKS